VRLALGRCPSDCGREPPVPAYTDRSYAQLPASPDQQRIEAVLPSLVTASSRVLHVGIGSSTLARGLCSQVAWIDGVTLLQDEQAVAIAAGLANHGVYLLDKYGPALRALPGPYDVIVDNNPGTWACCVRHVERLFDAYAALLAPRGRILTDERGAGWRVRGAHALAWTDWSDLGDERGMRAERITASVWSLTRD
jgi:hypothetical protein